MSASECQSGQRGALQSTTNWSLADTHRLTEYHAMQRAEQAFDGLASFCYMLSDGLRDWWPGIAAEHRDMLADFDEAVRLAELAKRQREVVEGMRDLVQGFGYFMLFLHEYNWNMSEVAHYHGQVMGQADRLSARLRAGEG